MKNFRFYPGTPKLLLLGNNRTKSVLVGLQGVVKKAVGLGGWHWLVLKNGVEVKLQRNALSVLEHPTGNEDDDLDYDNYSSSSDINEKDNDFTSSIEFHKFSKPRVRHARPCLQSISAKSNSRGSYREVHTIHAPQLRVNFAKLRTESLWRYCRRYNLVSRNYIPSRGQMVSSVQRHFAHQLKVDEVSVIKEFLRGAKRL
ncbi:Histone deacetylase complex subunit SAP30/SAP30-like [Quillaja saponaria]|nr:Histone deacetylase complex subunit SAP30/SAP30-like [Quillaja saponaria]